MDCRSYPLGADVGPTSQHHFSFLVFPSSLKRANTLVIPKSNKALTQLPLVVALENKEAEEHRKVTQDFPVHYSLVPRMSSSSPCYQLRLILLQILSASCERNMSITPRWFTVIMNHTHITSGDSSLYYHNLFSDLCVLDLN